MCHSTKSYEATALPKSFPGASSPPTSTSNPSPAQIITLLQSMSRSDWRAVKGEIKAEKHAIKTEMKAYEQALHADKALDKHERKAKKNAALAQLWGDALGRQLERISQRKGLTGQAEEKEGGLAAGTGSAHDGPEYQTLREKDEESGLTTARPPRYDQAVEKDYVKV